MYISLHIGAWHQRDSQRHGAWHHFKNDGKGGIILEYSLAIGFVSSIRPFVSGVATKSFFESYGYSTKQ